MRISDWSSDVCSSDLSRSADPPSHNGPRQPCRFAPFASLRPGACWGQELGERGGTVESSMILWMGTALGRAKGHRSEERSGGKGWVRQSRTKWSARKLTKKQEKIRAV